jgi:hypothetical protein
MQKHQNTKEIIREPKKSYKSIKIPIFYGMIVFFIVAISEKVGFSKYSNPLISPVSWNKFFFSGLPKAFLISFSIFVVLYFWQVIKRRSSDQK